MDPEQVMQNLGASSSLQQEGCAPASDNSISAEEVYAELNARRPVIVCSLRRHPIGLGFLKNWGGKPIKPRIPIRVVRYATAVEYVAAVGRPSQTGYSHYHEIESVD